MIELIDTYRIRYDNRHNAFTDMAIWNNLYYLVFRSGEKHIPTKEMDSKIVLMVSSDMKEWKEAHVICTNLDDRDPKLIPTPEKLIINFTSRPITREGNLQNYSVFTTDGINWSSVFKTFKENYIVWRPKKGPDGYYYVAADRSLNNLADNENRDVVLCRSDDGLSWEEVYKFFYSSNVNETEIEFMSNGEMVSLIRGAFGERGTNNDLAALGYSKSPYKKWTFYPAGTHSGGPVIINVKDKLFAATRKISYDIKKDNSGSTNTGMISKTAIYQIVNHEMVEILELPSGGDCAYGGFIQLSDEEVALSYYSSHEGLASVYIAKLRLKI